MQATSPNWRTKIEGSCAGQQSYDQKPTIYDVGTDASCKRCGNPLSMHRPEAQAHHSECTVEQFAEADHA